MTRGRLLLLTLSVVACTKSNPASHCQAGTCIDPAFPFCDMTGVVGGEPGACVSITCMPDKFLECRDDKEVRCNAMGNNYEVTQCSLGCDAAADGCRLCNPGETACTNGKVATCDANGTVVASTDCVLGCFESEPRCRAVQPSNGLVTYADMVANPPDIEFVNGEINTTTGAIRDQFNPLSVPNFLVPASNGASIRVLIVHNIAIQRLEALVDTYDDGPALAIVATGTISVTGLLKLDGGVGAFEAPGCSGGDGHYKNDCVGVTSGSGGGANATNGARGGDIATQIGGTAGIASGTASLVPLRGGCSAGWTDGAQARDGRGGGALQLTSASKISIDGIVDVRGEDGSTDGDPSGYAIHGGGGGGGMLLEAPIVDLAVNGQLLASGGGGGALCSSGTSYCGVAGVGAHLGTAALPGSNATCDGVHYASGGGGGGGLGRIRINTPDGTYTKANTAIEDGSVSTGMLSTR